MSKARLPVLGPIPVAELARFDRTESARVGLAVLHRELGLLGVLRLGFGMVWRKVFANPMRALAPVRDDRDRLTRIQLEPVLLLDAALRGMGLPAARVREVLRATMRAGGVRFLERFMVGALDRSAWAAATDAERTAFADGLGTRLFNAHVEGMHAGRHRLGFDVTRCLFVEALRQLGRLDLADLFCEVDAAFTEARADLQLVRTGTIATGASRCDFRFTLD